MNQIHWDRYVDFIYSRKFRKIPKDTYVEKHHIIPKSLNGENENRNIIKLTAREHFIAHLILWKCFSGKMAQSFYMMGRFYKYDSGLSPKQYEKLAYENSESQKGKTAWNKGIPTSEKTKQKQSESHMGKPSGMKGKHQSEETKKKNSESHMGKIPWNKGIIGVFNHSEEAKQKMREVSKGKKWINDGIKNYSVIPDYIEKYLSKGFKFDMLKRKKA